MQGFSGLDALHGVLEGLVERELVLRLARRPGQKEERYLHRLSEEAEGVPAVETAPEPLVSAPPRATRTERLEEELAALRGEMEQMRAQLAELRAELGLAD
jgi:uncharacterized protein YceH (UPF0502 family)